MAAEGGGEGSEMGGESLPESEELFVPRTNLLERLRSGDPVHIRTVDRPQSHEPSESSGGEGSSSAHTSSLAGTSMLCVLSPDEPFPEVQFRIPSDALRDGRVSRRLKAMMRPIQASRCKGLPALFDLREGDGGGLFLCRELVGIMKRSSGDGSEGSPDYREPSLAHLLSWRAFKPFLAQRMDRALDFRCAVRNLCEGLAFLHNRDIIHRRIIPSSILLGTDGKIPPTAVLAGLWHVLCKADVDEIVKGEGDHVAGSSETDTSMMLDGSVRVPVLSPELEGETKIRKFAGVVEALKEKEDEEELCVGEVLGHLKAQDVFCLGDVLAELAYGVSVVGIQKLDRPESSLPTSAPPSPGECGPKEVEDERVFVGELRTCAQSADVEIAKGLDVLSLRESLNDMRTNCATMDVTDFLEHYDDVRFKVLPVAQRYAARLLQMHGANLPPQELDNLRVRADPLFLDLVQKMMEPRANCRLSADEFLEHPFFMPYVDRMVWLSNVVFESVGSRPSFVSPDFELAFFRHLEGVKDGADPRAQLADDKDLRDDECAMRLRREVLGILPSEDEEELGKCSGRRFDLVRACAFRAKDAPNSVEAGLLRMSFGEGAMQGLSLSSEKGKKDAAKQKDKAAKESKAALVKHYEEVEKACSEALERADDLLKICRLLGGKGKTLVDASKSLFASAWAGDKFDRPEEVWEILFDNPDYSDAAPIPFPVKGASKTPHELVNASRVSELLRQVRNQWAHAYKGSHGARHHGQVAERIYHVLGGGLFLWVWKALQGAQAEASPDSCPSWVSFSAESSSTSHELLFPPDSLEDGGDGSGDGGGEGETL